MDRLFFSQPGPEFIFNEHPRYTAIESPHVRTCIVVSLLSAKLETWQMGRNSAKKLHEATAGGFTGMKYEIKPLDGDIVILLG